MFRDRFVSATPRPLTACWGCDRRCVCTGLSRSRFGALLVEAALAHAALQRPACPFNFLDGVQLSLTFWRYRETTLVRGIVMVLAFGTLTALVSVPSVAKWGAAAPVGARRQFELCAGGLLVTGLLLLGFGLHAMQV